MDMQDLDLDVLNNVFQDNLLIIKDNVKNVVKIVQNVLINFIVLIVNFKIIFQLKVFAGNFVLLVLNKLMDNVFAHLDICI